MKTETIKLKNGRKVNIKPIQYREPTEYTVKRKWKTDQGITFYNTGMVFFSRYKKPKELKEVIYLPNDLILKPNKKYKLHIDYPMRNEHVEEIITNEEGMRLIDLIDLIHKVYKKVYREEKRTSKLKEETIYERYGKGPMFNRAPTSGKYEIYGHVMDDLCIESIGVKGSNIYLSMES